MSRAVEVFFRGLSIVLKFVSLGWIIFAFLFVRQVIEARATRSALDYAAFPEIYTLQLVNAFFIPFLVGILCLGVSFLIDIWLAIRNQTKVIKQIDSKLLL